MKESNGVFPKDWQLILFAAIIFFLILQSCSTTKQIHQERTREEIQAKSAEETKTNTQAETNTSTKTTSETVTTEDCDTTVKAWITIDIPNGKKDTMIKVSVPVKFTRQIKRTEFQQQDQQKKDQGNTNIARNEQLSSKTDKALKDKTVERTGLPGWCIAIIILLILAGVAVLLWRLKVF